MRVLPALGGLLFLALAIPAGVRWRRFHHRGARLQAQFESVCTVLALAAGIVCLLMAAGRFA